MVIAVVFVIEVILGVLAFFFIDYVRNNLLEYFHGAMYTYQDDTDLKTAVDYIQKRVSQSFDIYREGYESDITMSSGSAQPFPLQNNTFCFILIGIIYIYVYFSNKLRLIRAEKYV